MRDKPTHSVPLPAANDGGDGWEDAFCKMKDGNLFDDNYDVTTLAFVYAFRMGFKAASVRDGYPAEFVEWMAQHTLRKGFDQYQYYKSGALFTKERLYTEWNKTKQ